MAAPSYAGSANGGAHSTTTPKTATVTGASAGYLIVVAITQISPGTNTYTVTDDQGHSYTKVVEQVGASSRYVALYYAIVVTTTGGSVVVSVAASGGIAYTFAALWASPAAGTSIALDTSSSLDATPATSHDCSSIGINTTANVLVVAVSDTDGSTGTVTDPTGYTLRQTLLAQRGFAWSRESVGALSAEKATWGSVNSVRSAGALASFKSVAGATAKTWWLFASQRIIGGPG